MKSCFTCLSLFVYFIVYTGASRFRCDYKYCKVSQAWFKYHTVPATWPDARLMCTLEGAVLASPMTREIRSCMMKSFRTPMFTGFHDTLSKGSYVSVDGSNLAEINHGWVITNEKPDYYKGGCLAIDANGFFINVDCYEPRPYVCYMNMTMEPSDECGTADPEYRLEVRTNKCYKFHTVPRNFSRANFACSAEGGHLAIINSEIEAKALSELFALYPVHTMIGNFWKDVAYVGFYDWGERGDWRTIHGQTLQEAGYAKFSAGEPNNSSRGEYCGAIFRTGKLNDLACDNGHAFICEKRPEYPPVCNERGEATAISGFQPKQVRRDGSKPCSELN